MKFLKPVAFFMAALSCGYALAASAFFTGRQEMVTTVTYQQAWRCEYDYLGKKYYFLFKGSCPSSVEIQ
jgi:hypothetical protein